ncbi:DNA adenine methylase [Acinetobacter populi]|jgi:adenine-specific DNA-methyltransferase|uniref:site-specific DNA-methyltransferase (adenine-specific) n=1 Tax=Acinetobacter populi TaxID=1582270 RepID=A0A1Z9YWY3_9GAMM|nr:DNA adenine methylase [Acinetobacter populi]MCH4249013.1 DNA adenine methylase [Acinetobacter populi]OUY06699.1 DNA modification methylase [Acinetobacter populi]
MTAEVSVYHKRRHAARTTDEYLFHQLVPYLGNKRRLLHLILEALEQTGTLERKKGKAAPIFVDFFAGSGVVSRLARQNGYRVIANDWEPYSHALNHALLACVEAPEFKQLGGYQAAIDYLNRLPEVKGWVTHNLCPRNDDIYDPSRDRLFFKRRNGMRIDAIRQQIATWQTQGAIDSVEMSALLAPLLYSASFVSNTSGVFKSFHQGWGGKTKTALERIDSLLWLTPSKFCEIGDPARLQAEMWCVDAQHLANQMTDFEVDVAYLDPPYNQHAYSSNYHVLNSLTLWDQVDLPSPDTKGFKSGIDRAWRKQRPSAYNSSKHAKEAYQKLLATINARYILTSYSTDGNIAPTDLLEANLARGKVMLLTQDVPRYRVSKQRQSERARVLEFIVITDTHAKSGPPLRQLLGQLYHFAELGGVDTSGPNTQLALW